MPPPAAGLPEGFRVALDPTVRRPRPDVLVGGSPVRLVRLSAAGSALVDGWQQSRPLPRHQNARALARRLTDAGLAHPVPPAGGGPGQGDVTVVIPARDRPGGVRATLRALGRGDSTGPVIVVDDGSRQPVEVRGATVVRRDRPGGPAAARNDGARRVTTPFVAFVDADCTPSDGWLEALLPHFEDPMVGAVAPRITTAVAQQVTTASTPANAQQVTGADAPPTEKPPPTPTAKPRWTTTNSLINAYEQAHSPLDMGARPGPVRPRSWVPYVPTAALVVRTAVLDEVGGFDEGLRFGEDVDLVWRLHQIGWRVRYEPAATVEHPTRPSPNAWLRQRFDYGRSAASLAVRHGEKVAPLDISGWSLPPWVLVLSGHPLLAISAAAVTAAALPVKTRTGDWATRKALAALAWKGNVAAGANLAKAVRRAWLPPLALAATRSKTARRAILASLLASGNPMRLLDDLAYQTGVWAGVAQARDTRALRALLPRTPARSVPAAPAGRCARPAPGIRPR